MRVAQLKRRYLPRTETFVHMQVCALRRFEPSVLVRQTENLELFPGPMPVAFVDYGRGFKGRWADLSYRAARTMSVYERRFFEHALQSLHPQLLHAHFAVDAAYFLPVKRCFDLPLVVSCYGYDVSSFPNRYFGLGRHYLEPVWRQADLVLAMSRDMERDLLRLGCPAEKIRVHYYGVDLARFPFVERPVEGSADRRPLRVTFVGSLGAERKGVDDLLRGFALAAGQYPDVELRIVGDGCFQSRYEHLSSTLRIADRVSFSGFVAHERVHEELARTDIFAHPSVTTSEYDKEGIPGTIVEAMATGLPIVTTRHAGIPEVVTDGEHGFVVAEHDIDAIARALVTLARDPSRRVKLGTQAAARARELADVVRQTAALEAIYDELIAAGHSSSDRNQHIRGIASV